MWPNCQFVLPKSEYGQTRVETLDDQLKKAFGMSVANNPTWVGMSPKSGLTAAIINRDVFVYGVVGFAFRYRLPMPPSGARFVAPRTLVVVEGRTGQVTTFDLSEYPLKTTALSSVAPHAFVGKMNTPIPTFNHGNCVGEAIPPKRSEPLPDGRTIRYDNPTPTHFSEKHRTRHHRKQSQSIDRPRTEGWMCGDLAGLEANDCHG